MESLLEILGVLNNKYLLTRQVIFNERWGNNFYQCAYSWITKRLAMRGLKHYSLLVSKQQDEYKIQPTDYFWEKKIAVIVCLQFMTIQTFLNTKRLQVFIAVIVTVLTMSTKLCTVLYNQWYYGGMQSNEILHLQPFKVKNLQSGTQTDVRTQNMNASIKFGQV